MKEEMGWVIETKDGMYWDGCKFVPDHLCAIRFCRQVDADTVMMYLGINGAFTAQHIWYS